METYVPEIMPQKETYLLNASSCPPPSGSFLKKRSLKLYVPKKVLGKSLKSKNIKK